MIASQPNPIAAAGIPGNAPPTSLDERPDNLVVMLFIAALFHAVIILGVTFTSGTADEATADTATMEVVLLTRQFEDRPDSDDAAYLAQQNLVGSGTTEDDAALRVAYGRNAAPVLPGPEQTGDSREQKQQQTADASDRLLFARTPEGGTIAENRQQQTPTQQTRRSSMPGTENSVEILATPDTESVLKGAKPRQLLISANTRESRVAAYLDSWKRRVERVGTINFPFELLQQPEIRNPVLSVSIKADGQLAEVLIVTGSNSRELDMAAVNILKLAAPFDPFPEYLRSDYDVLSFSYEWQFSGSRVGKMTVP